MKKILLFVALLCSIFVGKVYAEQVNYVEKLDYTEQDDMFKVKDGDLVCNLDHYFYGLYAYNYDGEEIRYVGRTGHNTYYFDQEEPDIIYSSNADADNLRWIICIKIDKDEIYKNAPGGVPTTDEFYIYKEDYYAGKASIIPYYEPDVEITCDKSSLTYGETSECTMTYKANHVLHFVAGTEEYDPDDSLDKLDSYVPACLETASFIYNNENFKIVDYSSEDYDIDFKNNKFTLEGDDVECSVEVMNELLKFTITPASEEVAGAKLEIIADDFVMTSSFGTSSSIPKAYMDINGDKENPKTSTNSIIYIVTAVCCLSLILLVLALKKTTFKKIS